MVTINTEKFVEFIEKETEHLRRDIDIAVADSDFLSAADYYSQMNELEYLLMCITDEDSDEYKECKWTEKK